MNERSPDAVDRLTAPGLIPVVEVETAREGESILDALVENGLPVAEITLRTAAALEVISTLRNSHPDALIGAGTVRTLEDVQRAVDAGAQFLVSPSTSADVIALSARYGVPLLPGVCTPTEIDMAVGAGASVVKLFPAGTIGGIPYLKSLLGPFRDVSFVPTGGINASNLADYLRVPQVVACGGSWIVAPALVREGRFDEVARLTREAVAIAIEGKTQ